MVDGDDVEVLASPRFEVAVVLRGVVSLADLVAFAADDQVIAGGAQRPGGRVGAEVHVLRPFAVDRHGQRVGAPRLGAGEVGAQLLDGQMGRDDDGFSPQHTVIGDDGTTVTVDVTGPGVG